MTTFLINPNGVFFKVECELHVSIKEECEIFDDIESMYEVVAERFGVPVEDVRHTEITIEDHGEGGYWEDDGRGQSECDFYWTDSDTIEHYITRYEV